MAEQAIPNIFQGNIPTPKYQIGDIVGLDLNGNNPVPCVITRVSVYMSRIHPDTVYYSYQVVNDFWGWSDTTYGEGDFVPVEITPENRWYVERFLQIKETVND